MDYSLSRFAAAGATGALAMYFFDPHQGRRRRALVRDQFVRRTRETRQTADRTTRDFGQRAYGMFAEAAGRFRHGAVADDVLAERVRAKMGLVVSHPSAISVRASQGRVTLEGPILAEELTRLLLAVAGVRGVTEIDNRFEVHATAGGVPGLQGESRRPYRWDVMQAHWSPATRLLAGSAAAGLALFGCRERGWTAGAALGTASLLLARTITNLELRRLFGLSARHSVDLRKAVNIDAPLPEVYRFFEEFENFPRFMSNVRAVERRAPGRFHWTVAGPLGVPVSWEAEVTEMIPQHRIAWRSLPGSVIQQVGRLHFRPGERGGTEVTVELSYTPPAGVLGHTVAGLFGAHPRRQMNEDLVRLKSLLEIGKTSVAGETIRREELPPQPVRS